MRRFNSLSTFNMSFVLLAAPESCQLAIWINAKEPEQSDIDNDTVFCPAGVHTPLSAGSAEYDFAEFEGLPDPLLYFS